MTKHWEGLMQWGGEAWQTKASFSRLCDVVLSIKTKHCQEEEASTEVSAEFSPVIRGSGEPWGPTSLTCQVATTCNKGALEQTVYVKNRMDGSFRTSSPATYVVATGEKPDSVYRITWQRHSPTFTSILTGRKTDLKSKQTNCCSGSFLCTRSIWLSSHMTFACILFLRDLVSTLRSTSINFPWILRETEENGIVTTAWIEHWHFI